MNEVGFCRLARDRLSTMHTNMLEDKIGFTNHTLKMVIESPPGVDYREKV